jgi:hypothetical protein
MATRVVRKSADHCSFGGGCDEPEQGRENASPAHPAHELVARNVDGATRQESCKRIQVGGDGGGVGEKAVDGDKRSKRGEYRQQAVESHAGCKRQNTMLQDIAIDAQQLLFPADRRGDGLARRWCRPEDLGVPLERTFLDVGNGSSRRAAPDQK